MGMALAWTSDHCVDFWHRIIAVNNYTLRSIEAEQNAMFNDSPSTYLSALVPAQLRTAAAIETLGEAMGVLSSAIQRLILDAQVNLRLETVFSFLAVL
jgi:hypothetical protein